MQHIASAKISGASFVATDDFLNAYVIRGKQITKFDSTLTRQTDFTDLNAGIPATIDPTNPLKILIFYPDFAQVNILDSRMALNNTIMLRDAGIIQPSAICYSYNECMWVYDRQDFQLKRINRQSEIIIESGNLSQITGYDIRPLFMTEKNNRLYVNDPEHGIFVFDIFGLYQKIIPIKKIKSFQIKGNKILYLDSSRLKTFDTFALYEDSIPLKNNNVVSAAIEKSKLYLIENDSLKIFKFINIQKRD